MSKQLLLSETKNFLVFAEDLNTNCIIIFEKDGVLSIYTLKKEETEKKSDTHNRISKILLRLLHALKSEKTSILTKITQFFTGKK